MEKISILYAPKIDNEEKEIIESAFDKNIDFVKYERKGIIGGLVDVEIIIDIIKNPYFTAFLTMALYDLIKKIFIRNNKKIMDNQTRPRYTNITLKMETKWIVISNINDENRVNISKISANSNEIEKSKNEYSDDKLEEYIKS